MMGLKVGIFVFQPDILLLGEDTCLRLLMVVLCLGEGRLGGPFLCLGEALRLGEPESFSCRFCLHFNQLFFCLIFHHVLQNIVEWVISVIWLNKDVN